MTEVIKNKHLVMYPDGGCRGTERSAGAGAHGYVWEDPEEPMLLKDCKQIRKDLPTSHGYIDDNNRGVLEHHKAIMVTPLEYIDYHRGLVNSTNNIGELEGAIFSLASAVRLKAKSLVLIPDSEYVINGVTQWLPKWVANNWVSGNGAPVKNQEYWRQIADLLAQLRELGTTLTVYWVNGHSGNLGNDEADRCATKGVICASKDDGQAVTLYSQAKGYWNYKADYNRMFFQPYWYFATQTQRSNRTPDGRAIYYAGFHSKEDDFFMKRSSDAYVSVMYLKTPEPNLEVISAYQEVNETGNYGAIYIGYLNNIFNSRTHHEMCDTGNKYLTVSEQKKNISYIDSLLTRSMRPALMSWCADSVFSSLQGILDEFERAQSGSTPIEGLSEICITDLTPLIYEVDVTKKKEVYKLTPEITQTTKSLTVELNQNVSGTMERSKVILTLGLDMPNRNSLSAIAAADARVFGVTWRESAHGFRYATVVQAAGDTCITAAMYANLIAIAK